MAITTVNTWAPKEIRACAESVGAFSTFGVTIASGEGVLDVGTILGKLDANGKYAKYDPADLPAGNETAVCILAEKVDATSVDVNALAYCRGIFVETELGAELDNGAKTDLGAISRPNGWLVLP